MNIDFITASTIELLSAVPTTLSLVFLSLSFGLVLAVFLSLMKASTNKILRYTANAYVYYFRGTPLLVQMYLLYFGVGSWISTITTHKEGLFWDIISEPYWYAVVALMFNTAGYTAEILRGAMQAVPHGQIESAMALVCSKKRILRRIIFPQAFRIALPSYSNEVILMVKGSSLASIITVMEITGVMSRLRAETYAVYELIAIAGTMYLILNYSITRIFKYVEKRTHIPI